MKIENKIVNGLQHPGKIMFMNQSELPSGVKMGRRRHLDLTHLLIQNTGLNTFEGFLDGPYFLGLCFSTEYKV